MYNNFCEILKSTLIAACSWLTSASYVTARFVTFHENAEECCGTKTRSLVLKPWLAKARVKTSSRKVITGDDSMSDDVFEQDEDKSESIYSPVSFQPPSISLSGSTGYRDYKPPAEVYVINQQSDSVQNFLQNKTWTSAFAKEQNTWETILHKTILLGDSGVGKTSLLVQFDTGKFQHGTFAATVGIGFTNKMILVDDSQVKLQIWDTAGQERFRSVTHAYYRDAHALLLLYDVTNKQSFDNIRAWLGEIREYAQDDVVIMLLGNKCDCGSDRVVRKEDGQRLASEYKVPFMETSAKTGLNVELAFHAVARELKARAKSQQDDHSDEGSFNVHDYLRQHQAQKSDNCFATNCLS